MITIITITAIAYCIYLFASYASETSKHNQKMNDMTDDIYKKQQEKWDLYLENERLKEEQERNK